MPHKPIDRENDKRWAILESYVLDIADRMGLGCYQYRVSHDAPPRSEEAQDGHDVAAQCDYSFTCLRFTVYFGDCFFDDTAGMQRYIVVHELLHVLEAQRMACINDFKQWPEVSITTWDRWFRVYDRAREVHTDWLANLLAPQYPLIDWGEL